jgi:hypothetical protein
MLEPTGMQAACRRMSRDGERETSPRVRALLVDMESTWTRLALEADQAVKQHQRLWDIIERDVPRHCA